MAWPRGRRHGLFGSVSIGAGGAGTRAQGSSHCKGLGLGSARSEQPLTPIGHAYGCRQTVQSVMRSLVCHSRHRRVVGGLLAAAAVTLLAVPASPAGAVVGKSGTQSCASGFYVQLIAKGQGDISFYIPTGTFRDVQFSSTITTVYYTSRLRSGTWTITSDDILSDSGTYARCVPGTVQPPAITPAAG